ncbi:hypothetical protein [Effusibacillus consociatus]|uniref:Uncharacterized protein n=1 Tax=Effusibacillus consociatus TaxID=1117041 RepID=A0ABV9Q722_9BACL
MVWLRNAKYDLGLLICPIVAVLLLYPLDFASSKMIEAVALGSLLLSGVHIGTNWTLLYRDGTFFRFDRTRYVHMGWLIILGSIALSAWNLPLFMSVYVYWGLWHFARQHWGISDALQDKGWSKRSTGLPLGQTARTSPPVPSLC